MTKGKKPPAFVIHTKSSSPFHDWLPVPPRYVEKGVKCTGKTTDQHLASHDIEQRAYHRAADLAKGYAEHWEAEARKPLDEDDKCPPSIKAEHWRIIEREIRGLANEPAE